MVISAVTIYILCSRDFPPVNVSSMYLVIKYLPLTINIIMMIYHRY